jgi:hypothetical protein
VYQRINSKIPQVVMWKIIFQAKRTGLLLGLNGAIFFMRGRGGAKA